MFVLFVDVNKIHRSPPYRHLRLELHHCRMATRGKGMKQLTESVAQKPPKHVSSIAGIVQRLIKKYGKLCFIILCVISIVLEGLTLTMVGANSQENGKAVGTVHKVIDSAKRLLGTMLNEPRALHVSDENGELYRPEDGSLYQPPASEWDQLPFPEWNQPSDIDVAPAARSGEHPAMPNPEPVVGFDRDRQRARSAVPMTRNGGGGGAHESDDERFFRDPLLTRDNTMCLRARSFKLVHSQVTVTTCLYRGQPMVDIRRWENGVLVPRLKPVVLSPREYFGLSRQYVNIAERIRSVQTLIRFPASRDDELVVEVDNGTPQINASVAKPAELHTGIKSTGQR